MIKNVYVLFLFDPTKERNPLAQKTFLFLSKEIKQKWNWSLRISVIEDILSSPP